MLKPKSLTTEKLFTNQKEVDKAIQAAVDKYNEIYSNNTLVKHKRSRHTKSKTQAPRKLRRNR
jgi:hypothetical protein